MTTPITILNNTDGPTVSIAGGAYRILISGDQTNGSYAVIEMSVPPGGGPGPHSHKDIQEMFFVVDGEVTFKTESGSHKATAGAFVNIPFGGAIHSFKNNSNAPAKLLCTVVPAGLEIFFKEFGKPVSPGEFLPLQPPTPEELTRLEHLAEKYGQKLYPPDFLD